MSQTKIIIANSPTTSYPECERTAFYDDEIGDAFLSAKNACPDEMCAISCALWDGVTMIKENGNCYLPSKWIMAEYPDIADDIQKVFNKIKSIHDEAMRSGGLEVDR